MLLAHSDDHHVKLFLEFACPCCGIPFYNPQDGQIYCFFPLGQVLCCNQDSVLNVLSNEDVNCKVKLGEAHFHDRIETFVVKLHLYRWTCQLQMIQTGESRDMYELFWNRNPLEKCLLSLQPQSPSQG